MLGRRPGVLPDRKDSRHIKLPTPRRGMRRRESSAAATRKRISIKCSELIAPTPFLPVHRRNQLLIIGAGIPPMRLDEGPCMGTRVSIVCTDGDYVSGEIYKHYDGYSAPQIVAAANSMTYGRSVYPDQAITLIAATAVNTEIEEKRKYEAIHGSSPFRCAPFIISMEIDTRTRKAIIAHFAAQTAHERLSTLRRVRKLARDRGLDAGLVVVDVRAAEWAWQAFGGRSRKARTQRYPLEVVAQSTNVPAEPGRSSGDILGTPGDHIGSTTGSEVRPLRDQSRSSCWHGSYTTGWDTTVGRVAANFSFNRLRLNDPGTRETGAGQVVEIFDRPES
jgi:hypothetical protein